LSTTWSEFAKIGPERSARTFDNSRVFVIGAVMRRATPILATEFQFDDRWDTSNLSLGNMGPT
jgi:hypothetical protein